MSFDLSDCTPRQCKCGVTVYDAPPLAGLLPMEKDGRTHSSLVCEVRAQLATLEPVIEAVRAIQSCAVYGDDLRIAVVAIRLPLPAKESRSC